MKPAWMICMAKEDSSNLSGLRLESSLEVAETDDKIWVRGPLATRSESLIRKLASLPTRERYESTSEGELRKSGERVPFGNVPVLPWQPISQWCQIATPTTHLPAQRPGKIALRLVPSHDEKVPELLLTELRHLSDYAIKAPSIRLKKLEYAVQEESMALVRGQPLPPLPGLSFVLEHGVGVPVGMSWEPRVSAEVMARVIGIPSGAGGLTLWNLDGTITPILGEQFVAVSRSGVQAALNERSSEL